MLEYLQYVNLLPYICNVPLCLRYNVPLRCGNGLVELDQLTSISFQDVGTSSGGLSFCLSEVKIIG